MELSAPAEILGTITEHTRVAADAGILRFQTESKAPRFGPGQFFQLCPWQGSDPLLGRPFSILDQGDDWISVLYQVMGRGTAMLADLRVGDTAKLIGPLGKPFAAPTRPGPILIVAGGVGIPPFLLVVRDLIAKGREAVVLLGARDEAHLYLRDAMTAEGARVLLATDDGSVGHKGFVTEILEQELARLGADSVGGIYTCGPEGMMHAVVKIARAAGVPGQASMERHMACGYGVCFTCVMKIKQPDGSLHNTRTCLQGPVIPFDRLPDAEW